jgi:hypothetical protein
MKPGLQPVASPSTAGDRPEGRRRSALILDESVQPRHAPGSPRLAQGVGRQALGGRIVVRSPWSVQAEGWRWCAGRRATTGSGPLRRTQALYLIMTRLWRFCDAPSPRMGVFLGATRAVTGTRKIFPNLHVALLCHRGTCLLAGGAAQPAVWRSGRRDDLGSRDSQQPTEDGSGMKSVPARGTVGAGVPAGIGWGPGDRALGSRSHACPPGRAGSTFRLTSFR